MNDTTMLAWDRQREHRFYATMAIAMAIVIFAGFARTFFLRPLFPDAAEFAAPESFFYLHGAVFALWPVLLIAQVTLIRTGNVRLHRSLGTAGVALAALIVVLGVYGSLLAANRPGGFIGVPLPPLTFLVVPFFDITLFGAFVATAFFFRRDAQSHKRLMLLATINILQAAIVRITPASWFEAAGPLVSFWLSDLFIVALVVYDFVSRRRLHPVTLWGGLVTIAAQPLRPVIGETEAWQAFATWAVGLVA